MPEPLVPSLSQFLLSVRRTIALRITPSIECQPQIDSANKYGRVGSTHSAGSSKSVLYMSISEYLVSSLRGSFLLGCTIVGLTNVHEKADPQAVVGRRGLNCELERIGSKLEMISTAGRDPLSSHPAC